MVRSSVRHALHARARGRASTNLPLALLLTLAVTISLPESHVCAQAAPRGQGANSSVASAPPGYDAAIDQALSEFERGSFGEAREHFLRAHKIFPNARTLRALGKAEYELRSYVDAATHLALALESQVRPLTSQQRSEAQLLLDHAKRHLARYTFNVQPDSAQLTLDGRVPPLDRRHSIVLGEGAYVLELSAEGFMPLRRDLQVVGGEDARLSLALSPLVEELAMPVAPDPIVPGPLAPSEVHASRSKWWLWTGLAIVIAGGATAGVLLALRDPEQQRASGGSSGVVAVLNNPLLASF